VRRRPPAVTAPVTLNNIAPAGGGQ
jgi:hypothetical protein